MIELKQNELNDIKRVELEILKEISRICKKYKLKYSLTGGTLLGAVRHKGFIPWDDDIDIVMPYEDYIKFLKYAETEMSKKFYIDNIYTDKYFGYLPMSKVMAHNTEMLEIPAEKCKAKSGIFVDIFPLYNTSNKSWIRKLDFKIVQRLSKNLRCRNGYKYNQSTIKSFIYSIRSVLYKLVPLVLFKISFDFIIKRNLKNNNSKYVASYAGVYGVEKEIIPREWFDEYIDIEFENNKFSSMKLWDPYLKNHYGDYMKLPPAEKRIPHHFLLKYKNDFFK